MKTVTIPFDLELAKKITNKEIEGEIKTVLGDKVRIVCFDRKDQAFPIIALHVDNGYEHEVKTYTDEGNLYSSVDDPLDLVLEVPEYITWKDGDILYDGTENYIAILKEPCKMFTSLQFDYIYYHVLYDITNDELKEDDSITIDGFIPASNDQIEIISNVFRYRGKRWNPDTLQLEDLPKEPEKIEFETFQHVLGRDTPNDLWLPDEFAYKDPYSKDPYFICMRSSYKFCIPYDGNEHLKLTNKSK